MRIKRIFYIALSIIALSCLAFFIFMKVDHIQQSNIDTSKSSTKIAAPEIENLALGKKVTTSSSSELAAILVDGQALPNASWHTSWDPPQDPARPSWIMIDLGEIHSIKRFNIIFPIAAYDGIYDIWAPPHSIVIEMGDSPDQTKPVHWVSTQNIPDQGACTNQQRLSVELNGKHKARFVKLSFPKGGKLPLMPDVVGLAGVEIYGPTQEKPKIDKTIQLVGDFGAATINMDSPQLTELFLREPDGSLSKQSLLAEKTRGLTLLESKNQKIFNRQGAYSYITDKKGQRFESRFSRNHKISTEKDDQGSLSKISFTEIRLTTQNGIEGPVEEDWVLEKTKEGELSWTITQRWLDNVKVDISGTPALYLARFGGQGAYRDRRVSPVDPQITSTLWYHPKFLTSGTHPDYETYATDLATEYRTHTVNVKNSWAIYKLFTNFHLNSDPKLSVKGGYLYRRAGVRNDFNEIGSTTESTHQFKHQAADVLTLQLKIASVDKFKTGEQLDVEIPDATLIKSLRDLHASILNGGIISDPKRYHFGNGTEDANYAGSSAFQALALSVSHALGQTTENRYLADQAFKGHLEQILATVDSEGLVKFGFNPEGMLLDNNLQLIHAIKIYVLKTGDKAFIEQHETNLNRMVNYFIDKLDATNGLFKSPAKAAHWYYDGIAFSGFNTYYQTFLYQALNDLVDMLEIVGKKESAQLRKNQAQHLASAINAYLWYPDAPFGPQYADWIDENGKPAFHFIDIVQYPLIALNVASPMQAEDMLKTADKRLAELKRKYGHSRQASLSLLWPISTVRGEQCFGNYFYGGSILSSTYWEVLARSKAGHINGEWGAYSLLQNFAKQFENTSFVGSNSIDIRGNTSLERSEGYSSDMVVVPASLIYGLLGIELNWDKIKVDPKLPRDWNKAKVNLFWKGDLYEISINNNIVNINQVNNKQTEQRDKDV